MKPARWILLEAVLGSLLAAGLLVSCREEKPAPRVTLPSRPVSPVPVPAPPPSPSAFSPPTSSPAPKLDAMALPDEGPLVSPSGMAAAPGGSALRFGEALSRILAHYPELQRQHARVEEALARQSLAVAGFLPRLQGRLGWQRTDDPTGVFMSKLKQRSFQTEDFLVDRLNHPGARDNFQGALRIEFPLFDAFQTIAAARTAAHSLKSEREMDRFARAEAGLLAVESWLQAALADRREAIARESLARSQRDLAEAEGLREQGLVLGADFYAGRVMVDSMEQRDNGHEAARAVARAALNILQGEAPEKDFALAARLPAPVAEDRTTAAWIEEALARRADLAASRSALAAQRSEVGRDKARLLPDVSLFAEGEGNTRAFEQHGENYTVGARITFDLFDPAYPARVRAAEARFRQLEQEDASLRDAIATSITQARAHLDAARRNLTVLDRAACDGREAVRLTRGLYRDGRKSIADLLAARSVQLDVESAREQALVEAEAARVRLIFLAGALDDAVLDAAGRRLDPVP